MKRKYVFVCCILSFLVLSTGAAEAATHVITFGSSLTYNPSILSVEVGDMITWEGDFSSHPLSSVSVPDGAQPWHVGSGNSFTYTVQVPGGYGYKCDFHVSMGMAGGFTASSTTGVSDTQTLLSASVQNAPNPFRETTLIRFELPAAQHVSLKIFDVRGQEVASILNEERTAGSYEVPFSADGLADGVYFYELRIGETVIRKAMLLMQ